MQHVTEEGPRVAEAAHLTVGVVRTLHADQLTLELRARGVGRHTRIAGAIAATDRQLAALITPAGDRPLAERVLGTVRSRETSAGRQRRGIRAAAPYEYLFYEADLRKLDLPNEGWIVEYSKLNSWFNQNLIKLGLNEKEIYQFKEYWMKELPNSKYYEIKLLEDNFLRDNMNLIIEPQPETIIRINFHFKPLNEKYPLPLKKISNKKRLGFTVVEWGGILQE